jgi:hypothetical protein
MNVSDRKLLLAAAAGALLLVVLAVVLSPGGETSETPTTYSSGSGGAKALYLTLRAAHYPVSRWERSPRDLPTDANATLILAEPDGAPTSDERAAVNRFLEHGGRVIATGPSGASFLPNRKFAADPIAGLTWTRAESQSPSLVTRAAPEITLAPRAYWQQDQATLPLYADAGPKAAVRVVKAEVGKGEMIWWASATPLSNAGVKAQGNLAFVLACLGDSHRPILWDEYFHGHRQTRAPSAFASPFSWSVLPFAIGAIAVLMTYARRSGPIIVPAAESRLSPLEFVRTLGLLYERAGAASVAVDIAYQRFRYGLRRRLGAAGGESADDLARAIAAAADLKAAAIADLLRACGLAKDDPRLTAADALTLTRSLHDYGERLDLFRSMTKERL